MFKELGELFKASPKEAALVYREALKEGDKAVIVGPSKSVFVDPTSLEAAEAVGSRGTIYLADPLYFGNETSGKGGTPRPEGNVSHLLEQFANFKTIGLN